MADTLKVDEYIDSRLADGLCPRCMSKLPPVEVHGHVQCTSCHLYIQECCTGEGLQDL